MPMISAIKNIGAAAEGVSHEPPIAIQCAGQEYDLRVNPSREDAEALEVAHALDMIVSLPPYTDDASLPAAVQVACLESYFTNLRVLIEFLGLNRRKNSIKAEDFVPGWTYPTTARADHLKTTEYGFASEQVSHLSKSRVLDPNDPVVNVHPLRLRMLALLMVDLFDEEFLPAVRAAKCPQEPQFKAAVELARNRLAPQFS